MNELLLGLMDTLRAAQIVSLYYRIARPFNCLAIRLEAAEERANVRLTIPVVLVWMEVFPGLETPGPQGFHVLRSGFSRAGAVP